MFESDERKYLRKKYTKLKDGTTPPPAKESKETAQKSTGASGTGDVTSGQIASTPANLDL